MFDLNVNRIMNNNYTVVAHNKDLNVKIFDLYISKTNTKKKLKFSADKY